MRLRPSLLTPLFALGLLALSAQAWAAPRLYVLALGYNGAKVTPRGASPPPLRFADDDAAAFFSLVRDGAAGGALHTLLDGDTVKRFPELLAVARPPSLADVRRSVADLKRAVDEDRQAGRESTVIFYYSGHGLQGGPGEAALLLADGGITTKVLYDEILRPLDATYVHIVVDACHAEDIVRPRDLQATVTEATADEITDHLARTTLAAFPRAGALIATTSSAEAHEWDAYQGGVFTHELLSALRGGADVNGDGRLEYSEVAAFVAAANREVTDSRGRIAAVIRAPAANPRATLFALPWLPSAVRLRGRAQNVRAFQIEDGRGNHLVQLRAEHGYPVTLVLPAAERLYVRTTDSEAEINPRPGEIVQLSQLAFRPIATAKRGALSAALRQGLFATEFGVGYYRGFVDGADFVPVELREELADEADAGLPRAAPAPKLRWLAGGASIALGTTAVVFGALTLDAYHDYQSTGLQRQATAARDRFYTRGTATGVLLLSSLVLAGVAALISR